MIILRLLLDYYVKLLVFRENSKLIVRLLSTLTLAMSSIRLLPFLVLSLLKWWQLCVCPAAQALIRRLVRCFAHTINVFEHKFRLFGHSHGSVVHLLQRRYLICWVLQVVLL